MTRQAVGPNRLSTTRARSRCCRSSMIGSARRPAPYWNAAKPEGGGWTLHVVSDPSGHAGHAVSRFIPDHHRNVWTSIKSAVRIPVAGEYCHQLIESRG